MNDSWKNKTITDMKTVRLMILAAMALMVALSLWADNRPWLTRVYEYHPAPGQFVNTLPVARVGEPVDSILARCHVNICGRIDTITQIVMVGVDTDGDGVPSDGDKWYELAGSDYDHPTTQHDYAITYYRPDEGKPRTPSQTDPSLIDTTYIHWTSNDINPDSTSGYMSRNSFHMQPYWPLWLQGEETLSFTGTKLRCNAVDIGGNDGNAYYVQYNFAWGYADNLPNHPGRLPGVQGYNPGFKIDWAVDEQGNHVNLTHIDFIKVYNAVNQYCGWIGETSTEVAGGIDFHPDAVFGDVNGDKEVNISDVNAVIAVILTSADSPLADVNGDGEVNISDINTLIAVILH